jgi:putative transposase
MSERRAMIERGNEKLSTSRQCRLLGVSRSTYYHQPKGPSIEDLELMKLIDRQYLRTPFYGSRKMAELLTRVLDRPINRKRVQGLMRLMGIEAIYQKPNTSRPGEGHKIYPYLLGGLEINRPGMVFASDITYIPMRKGFLYLVAVMDWFSRYVLSWRLSNTLEADFCVEALEQALEMQKPDVFNVDQGSQFTSTKFTGVLLDKKVKISMDGKGRFMDNIFVERLWRSLKYEEIYLKAYDTVKEAKTGIGNYMNFYNYERLHQALGYKTAWEVHNGLDKQPWPNAKHHLIECKELDFSKAIEEQYKTKWWNQELSLNLTL